jgi:hypothetical protein
LRRGELSLADPFEQMLVEPFMPDRSIESLDIRVLRRFAGLDEQQLDPALSSLNLELDAEHLASVV